MPKGTTSKKVVIRILDSATGLYKDWDGVLSTGDIEIGAVEIKDGTSDDRASVDSSGNLSILLSGISYESGKSGIDAVTETLQIIKYEHHEIHEGNHYYLEGCTTLDSGNELRVKLVTPDTTKWSHFVWQIQSSNILTTEFYEGASGGMTGGSAVTPINNNRNSVNTSGLTITSGVTTATSDGTLISEACWGSRQAGGSISRSDELILKQNETYLRKFISGANSNLVSFKASWYEHTNKN